MDHGIGQAAGKVWYHLNGDGPSTVPKIVKATGLPQALVHRAIGWLAREDKLVFDKTKRGESISLR